MTNRDEVRPVTLEDIAGQHGFVSDAKGWAETGKFPNAILLYGNAGTGKTSSAEVLARVMLGEYFDPVNYVITNASDDRGIDFIRNELKGWSGVRAIGAERRVIVMDEADGLTPAAQDAARQIIETNADTTLFILTANDVSKIRPAIRSRCLEYEFTKISPDDGCKRLLDIFQPEAQSDELREEWANAYVKLMNHVGGDMRSAIAIADMYVAPQNLLKKLSHEGNGSKAALAAISGEYGDMRKQFYSMLDRGMSLTFVMSTFHKNLTEFFAMDEDTTWTVMSVLGEMIPHMYEWPIGSHSFVDCLVARLRKEVKTYE
tara:strand:+ start:1249 stop:2199 length:951 start_codon:yes stop_codon:yes gene_type:complete